MLESPSYAVFHSTTPEAWEGIRKTGLLPGGGGEKVRDVHMWIVDGEKKGRELDKVPLTIKVNVDAAMSAGIAFWRASNDVILTDKPLPPAYLQSYLIQDGRVPWKHPFFSTVEGGPPTPEEEEDPMYYNNDETKT
jgi:RNA:NAD 2'-phosphotransferase (TPT1/KptA family)